MSDVKCFLALSPLSEAVGHVRVRTRTLLARGTALEIALSFL